MMGSEKKHALLSASSAHRWLNCPPSARLCEHAPDTTSAYADEGTQAHALGEHKLKKALGLKSKNPTKTLSAYTGEMEDCAEGYAAYILELIEGAKKTCCDPIVLIEQRLDFSAYVEEGFGTGDCVIIADGTLHVIDYKHGAGVLVEANENPQMMLYALGALELFDCIYDIQKVSMTIYQPRRDNISTYTLLKHHLRQWAGEVLKPAAALAYAGAGEFQSGEWCRFCLAKQNCRARAEANIAIVAADFARPPKLTDDEIDKIIVKIDAFKKWAADIEEYVYNSALGGKKWKSVKLVEGRSNRKYTDEEAVAAKVQVETNVDPYERSVKGITAMEKALGKKRFTELLEKTGLVYKPRGKPSLVPRSDEREEYNDVAADFATPLNS